MQPQASLSPPPLIAFRGVQKVYPNGTQALKNATFTVERATIHAICGENGAGKSTLMKILFGLTDATSGEILFSGTPAQVRGAALADRYGIGMVHQHFSLIPTLPVWQNIILGHEPRKGLFIDHQAAKQQVAALMTRYGLQLDVSALTGTLSVAAQQKVEILKALSRNINILILDEPTAVLSPPEIDELFVRLEELRQQGMTLLFISHKLNEVRRLAKNVTVLRNGVTVDTVPLSTVPDSDIMQLVMGKQVNVVRRKPTVTSADVVVSLSHVTLNASDPASKINDINLTLHRGEIVGVAGVDGSGQRGLVALLAGQTTADRGEIRFDGQLMGTGVESWRKQGMAWLPEDRFHQGGCGALSLADNAIAGTDGDQRIQQGPFLKQRAIVARVKAMINEYAIRCPGPGSRLDALSGGNAQKLIAARELAAEPRFLIAEQPTRGIDVASAAFLHQRITDAAAHGAAVLLVTADLDELLRLSDRVVVMFNGRITAIVPNGPAVLPATLGPYMLGLEQNL